MKRIVLLFVCFTVCYADPGNVDAFLWNYTVGGTIENVDDHTQFTVSGNMIIDDTLRLWDGDAGSPAPSASPVLGNAQYSYFIAEYSLEITEVLCPNEYAFSGAGGSFYMERPAPWGMGDLMWFLENGSGDWNWWVGEHFYWYHEDMTPYDLYNEMDELAPIIRLTSLDYFFDDPIFSDWVTTDILLTRTAPVPEPATILLIGIGLIGLAGFRKKFKK